MAMTPEDDDYDNEPWYNALDDDDCYHEDADRDILSGIAVCSCGHRWTMTGEEIRQENDHIAAYCEMQEREYRRQRWRDRLWPLPGWWESVRDWFRAQRAAAVPERRFTGDDEIPF